MSWACFNRVSDTGKTYVEDSLVCKSASGHDEGAGTSYSSDVLGTHFDDLSMRCGLKIRVVECGGKEGWDEWKTRLTPQRQPSTWKIPGQHHPEYSTTAQFQDLHLGQFCKFCAPAIADSIAKWAVKRRIKGCCVTSMHIYVTQHSRRTTTNGSDA